MNRLSASMSMRQQYVSSMPHREGGRHGNDLPYYSYTLLIQPSDLLPALRCAGGSRESGEEVVVEEPCFCHNNNNMCTLSDEGVTYQVSAVMHACICTLFCLCTHSHTHTLSLSSLLSPLSVTHTQTHTQTHAHTLSLSLTLSHPPYLIICLQPDSFLDG